MMVHLICTNNYLAKIFISYRITLENSLRSKEVKAQEASVQVALALTRHRQGRVKEYAVKHAVATAEAAGLSIDSRSDISILARTIR